MLVATSYWRIHTGQQADGVHKALRLREHFPSFPGVNIFKFVVSLLAQALGAAQTQKPRAPQSARGFFEG